MTAIKPSIVTAFLVSLLALCIPIQAEDSPPLWGENPHGRPNCVKGIHLTSWYTGSQKARARFEPLFAETELNTAVIDIKEIEGEVYIPGVTIEGEIKMYTRAIRDIEEYLTYLKDRGVYTIARIVCFQDGELAKKKPEWAVKSSSPLPQAVELGYEEDVWYDQRKYAWVDPYNVEVHDYLIDIAEQAAKLGFQGVQFDYVRFPTDGLVNLTVYSQPFYHKTAVRAITNFLARAKERLRPYNIEISIDIFGLAGVMDDGLGIGQKLSDLIPHVDAVSPMMYPSHYAPGELGIPDPNSDPYTTIYKTVQKTLKVIKDSGVELRPFLQDFSLGVKYTADHVRAQIQAANDLGVDEWLLWNPRCRYTREALLP